jgi:hypothetical protein
VCGAPTGLEPAESGSGVTKIVTTRDVVVSETGLTKHVRLYILLAAVAWRSRPRSLRQHGSEENPAMTSEQLKATIRQQPFRPFIIRMVDGRSFAVSHPDFVMVSPTGRTAILFEPDDSYSVVDLMLMNELDVPAPKAAG